MSQLFTFGSISARTSFKTCRSCMGSNESNVMRLKLLLNGSLLSCSTMNFSCSLMLEVQKYQCYDNGVNARLLVCYANANEKNTLLLVELA